ncbi:flagellar biosynthetic protein FliR [Caminicella sporogenes]|nr:flagellar biosynthetic protein FliR [Caminicella sporogenes]RKD27771.1 flagellar biosynthetic protein FliR [Caminicella sporogenes]WIF94652.1 flagellar biosynthetic protein FliR [Caminicella sporogenes]
MDLLKYTVFFLLIFIRISGIFLMTPLFGSNNIPNTVKIGFSLFFTYIVFPLIDFPNELVINNFTVLFIYLVLEFLNGLMFGFISLLILNSIYVAGMIVDRNIGFSIVNVISPQDESEMPVSANLYYTIAILIFLLTDSHHILIKALIQSFRTIPIGYRFYDLLLISKVTQLMRTSFIIGFKIAAPIIVTIFITNVLLGILSRSIPQMNVFIVGMPLKIFIGLLTIYIALPLYFKIFKNIFDILIDTIRFIIKSIP